MGFFSVRPEGSQDGMRANLKGCLKKTFNRFRNVSFLLKVDEIDPSSSSFHFAAHHSDYLQGERRESIWFNRNLIFLDCIITKKRGSHLHGCLSKVNNEGC